MAVEEIDVLKHLVEVERELSTLVFESQKKSDAIITNAKAQADEEFHKLYSVLVKEEEQIEKSSFEKINLQHNIEIQNFRESLDSLKKTESDFNSLMNSLLFA